MSHSDIYKYQPENGLEKKFNAFVFSTFVAYVTAICIVAAFLTTTDGSIYTNSTLDILFHHHLDRKKIFKEKSHSTSEELMNSLIYKCGKAEAKSHRVKLLSCST